MHIHMHILNYDVISEIQLCEWMRIWSKNNDAKFHVDSIGNDGALGFFQEQQQEEERDE